MEDQYIIIDKIKWVIHKRTPEPLCPIHNLRLRPVEDGSSGLQYFPYNKSKMLQCEDCQNPYVLPRSYGVELSYVIDKVDSKIFKGMKFINLDDEAIPIAKTKKSSQDNKFFVTAQLMKSKVGLRLIIYAGEKGGKEKTQIFVEPDIKRLSFDQNNLHPKDVFSKIEATFIDGTKYVIKKKSKK